VGINTTAALSWKNLAVFESSDLVRRLYKRRHNLELNAGTAKEITTALAQGRQYFAELRSVGELARPLVLFYGVMSLSRAAILFLKPGTREESLEQGHGLTAHNWKQTLSGGIKSVPDLQLKVAAGTFTELANATHAIDRVVVHAAPYPNTIAVKTTSKTDLSAGWSMTLRDLLGRIPELHNIYEETFDEFPYCRRVFVFLLAGPGPFQTTIDTLATRRGLPTEEQVRLDLKLAPAEQLTKHPNHNFLGAIEHWSVQQQRQSLQDILDHLPYLINDSQGNVFVVPLIHQSSRLSKLLMLYATSYALGMLGRYYPSRWMALLTGGSGDFSYPLLAEASRVIEDVFPQMLDAEFWAKD
jgi:hypothetical protein